MRRREALAVLAGGTFFSRTAAAHPTPVGTPGEGTPRTREDTYGPVGRVEIEGTTDAVVTPDGATAFVAATTGYAVVDLSDPTDPTVIAERRGLLSDRENGPLRGIYDVKRSGDTLLVVGPANPGQSAIAGALVVDVSDPADPQHRSFYETPYPIHNAFLDGDTAYLTANTGERRRLAIVDVSGEPTAIAEWDLTDYDDDWELPPPIPRILHDVYVQDDVAYLAHWDAGTWLLDVSDPSEPSVISHIGRGPETVADDFRYGDDSYDALPGNDHYAAVDEAGDLLAIGREAWATEDLPEGGPGGIDLYDISDPAAPRQLSTIQPPPTPDATQEGSWTTAHNFEFRDGVLYSAWYRGGVKRHDVSDPTAPEQLTWWADRPHAEFWTARVGVPGSTFVASSRATTDSAAALYVFPDGPGETTWGFGDDPAVATRSPTAIGTDAPSETAADGPGFGALTGLAGIGVGTLAWWRSRSE
ncbi:hypothetical protein JCM30237_15910 [Halolamina litorea]|uniref:LVIVD repeat-containing protein n=1 Tax=Halolamina litorea TaxID=1515593 RepID=A0ABD6BQD8_9EURY|nr:hypothetical protein [Halolamina litorea]